MMRTAWLKILGVFIIVQLMVIGMALVLQSVFPPTQGQPAVTPPFNTSGSVVFYVIYLASFGVALALFFKYGLKIAFIQRIIKYLESHKGILFFIMIPVIGFLFLFAVSSVLGEAPPQAFIDGLLLIGFYLAAMVIGNLALKIEVFRLPAHMILFAIIGTMIGLSFSFDMALLFLALFAIYDFIAVFITKHMLVLAKALGKESTSVFMLVFKDGEEKRILGSGDLLLPAMIVSSAVISKGSVELALYVAVGAMVGLLLALATAASMKRPLPAIPFIMAGLLPAVGIFYALNGDLIGMSILLAVNAFLIVRTNHLVNHVAQVGNDGKGN